VQFHTNDVKGSSAYGSGLRSIVMWDPASKVKFANNEPWRPHFRKSQIHIFTEENRGPGIQHLALGIGDILTGVKELKDKGIQFMPTPGAYYDMLPDRIAQMGIGKIDEEIEDLRHLEILVDGEGPGSYLLQIFMKEASSFHKDPEAGPFFYEIIQRKGNQGFGEGNFRALFDSIEREQTKEGRG
jgi:4-hydroxyphenylpyruvate dioxygenase